MATPIVPVGFDYTAALKRIRTRMSLAVIADYLGYESRAGVQRVINGSVPSHPQGEAIWALYVELFNEKPPHSPEQLQGGSGSYLFVYSRVDRKTAQNT